MQIDGITIHIFTAVIFFAIGVWYASRKKGGGGKLGKGLG
jgi:hypothetical protein